MFDWNDLRFFLELQRSGRLLTAARRLNTTHATVARHIEAIEKSLGTALFVQHAQGYEMTPAGEALLKHAEAMENVALLAQEEITQSTAPLGKIRVGVTEGLGVKFLASRMIGLFERYLSVWVLLAILAGLGLGLAGINLLLIALAVSAVNPRAGRSYHLGLALFVFIAYYNMLNVGQSWIGTGRFAFLPFMVMLHGGVFLIAILWLSIRHYNWSWRFLLNAGATHNKGHA